MGVGVGVEARGEVGEQQRRRRGAEDGKTVRHTVARCSYYEENILKK